MLLRTVTYSQLTPELCGGELGRNFGSLVKGNFLLVFQVFGTVIVVVVGVVHAAALENQEGMRFRDTDSARAAGSIGKGTAVSAASTICFEIPDI